tara:strand:- start:2252 stop:2710 length:459 start_codon:yes stop_codon:yes gene_type:complete
MTETEAEIVKQLQPNLQEVLKEAKRLSEIEFLIVEGKRTKERHDKLGYLGEDWSSGEARFFGCAVTLLLYSDDIPCFSEKPYWDLADSIRYGAQNAGDIGMNWGGAKDRNGYVNITKWDGTIEDLTYGCYGDLLEASKDYRPVYQYFQLHAE